MSLVSHYSDRLVVMYAGQVAEAGPTRRIFDRPLHPYSRGLLEAFPGIRGAKVPLSGIPGAPPDLSVIQNGCSFSPRCPVKLPACETTRPALLDQEGTSVRCLLYDKETGQVQAAQSKETAEMRKILSEIQDGSFTRELVEEFDAGQPNFAKRRSAEQAEQQRTRKENS
jgi:oligopeptide/dipeptide ABC transporter ATP-binding protein